MSVTIIRGRSGSGKSRFLMKHIKNLIQDPLNKVIVITAGSLTFETERNIIRNCGVSGILGLQVFSIQRLAYAILEDTQDFMTNADKAMVCKKALMHLDNPFHGAAKTPDFINCLTGLITKLKDHNQTPESLREVNTNDTALKEKLNDTADVLELYQSLCGNKKDTGDMYALAAKRAKESDLLKGAHVIIDGMDSYSPSVMLLITKVIEMCSSLYIAFRSPGTGSEEDLFASEQRDMMSFVAAVKNTDQQLTVKNLDSGSRYSSGELSFLERNLYSYPYNKYDKQPERIELYEAQTIENEVDMIASNILKEVASGRNYSDIAVVAGNLPGYIPTLKMKLELSDIPFFIDERRTLTDNTFFDYLYKSLLCAAGEKPYALSYAFCRYSPLSEDEKYKLRKYIQTYSYKGWHLYSPFRRGDDAEENEKIRRKVIKPIKKLEEGISQHKTKLQIEAIITFLNECSSRERLEDLCLNLEENGMNAEREYFSQVYENTLQVLKGISSVFKETPIPAKELIELIKTGCDATKIAIIPPSTDEVGIFDISVARLKNIDVLFAAGVQDGVWPSKNSEPSILSETELSSLMGTGLDLGMNDLSSEKLKIYTALVKPKDKLYISYNQSSPPSVLIDRIRRIFPELKTKTKTPMCAECTDSSVVLSEISAALNDNDISKELVSACAALMQKTSWKDHARSILTRTNDTFPLSEPTAVSLYGGIKCSATRIENYYKCPFSHFVSRGLKAKPVREYVGNALDTGTYVHLALDIFASNLIKEGKDIKDLSVEEIKEDITLACELAAQQHDDAKLIEDERFSALYDLLKEELTCTALRIHSHFINTQAKIYSSEQEFKDYTVKTRHGDITINGKIDRIDTAGSYFRVVDYKSSKKTFSLSEYASGISLQLPIYIGAVRRLLEEQGLPLYPAGGYYMQTGEGYMETSEDLASAGRLFGISLNDPEVLLSFSDTNEKGGFTAIDQRITSKGELHGQSKDKFFTAKEMEALLEYTDSQIVQAAEGIYSGVTKIQPVDSKSGSDVCSYCEYKSVCMKDEGFVANASRQIAHFSKDSLGAGL